MNGENMMRIAVTYDDTEVYQHFGDTSYFKIYDVQARCGFNTPQAIFKWMRGDAVPTIDNLVILADMLDTPIDKILIVTRI